MMNFLVGCVILSIGLSVAFCFVQMGLAIRQTRIEDRKETLK
jgi:hypothetical protein